MDFFLIESRKSVTTTNFRLTITHESYNIVQKCIFLIQELEFNRLINFYEIHNDYTKLYEIFKYRL